MTQQQLAETLDQSAIDQMCEESTIEVLDAMFFEPPVKPPEWAEHPSPEAARANVMFEGSLCGRVSVAAMPPVLSSLAASFLGRDAGEIGESERWYILAELANIACGSLLSRLAPEGHMRLSPPIHVPELEGAGERWMKLTLADGELYFAVRIS